MNRIATLIALFLFTVTSHAQNCMPDTALKNQGIYPDSATNVPAAQVGVPYDVTITAVVPADTMVVLIPNTPPQQVLIDSIVLEQLLNAPAWVSLTCEPHGCAFPGGGSGCGRITGTPPPGEGGKTYEIGFVVTTYGRLAILPGQQLSQTDTNHVYYHLYVDFGAGQEPIVSCKGINVVYPNPAHDQLSVSVVHDGTTQWTITDMLGQKILDGLTTADKWTIPVSGLQRGLYLIELKWNGQRDVIRWIKQ